MNTLTAAFQVSSPPVGLSSESRAAAVDMHLSRTRSLNAATFVLQKITGNPVFTAYWLLSCTHYILKASRPNQISCGSNKLYFVREGKPCVKRI